MAGSRARLGLVGVAVACTVVAGLARWWVHHDLYALDPTLLAPGLDDEYYRETAVRIARGESFDSFLAPLQPFLATRLASGADLTVAFLGALNAGLGSLTSGVVALAAGWAAGRRAAWTAGLLHALAGVFLFHDVLPGQEAAIGLATAVVIFSGVALAAAASGPAIGLTGRGAPAALFGAAVGTAALGRGTSLVLLACLLPALRRRAGRVRVAGLAAAALALVLAAGAAWNQHVAGTFSPFPWSGSVNLYIANGPDARATVSMTADELGWDPWTIERNAIAIPERELGRTVTRREASRWWLERTARDLGSPFAVAGHMLRKAVLFWTSDERGSNHTARAEGEFATLLRLVPTGGWWLLALGAGAWWLVRRSPAAAVPALAIAGVWFALTVFFPVGRYRIPALIASAVLVGMAVSARHARRQVAAALAVTAAIGLLAWAPVRARDAASGHVNVARAMAEIGAAPADIEQRLRVALAADPDSGPALELLGRLALHAGRAKDAYDLFVRAAQDRRTRFRAQVAALPALVALRRLGEARTVATGLLRENGDDVELLANAALVAAAAGGMGDAQTYLDRARAIDPRHPALILAESRLR